MDRRGFIAGGVALGVAAILPTPAPEGLERYIGYPTLKANIYGTSPRVLTEAMMVEAFEQMRKAGPRRCRHAVPYAYFRNRATVGHCVHCFRIIPLKKEAD